MEATSSARPLPHFEYMPTDGCEPSHRHHPVASPRHSERMQEAPRVGGDRQSQEEHRGRSIGAHAYPNHLSSHRRPAKSTTASTPYETHSRQTAWFEEQEQTSCPRREVSERRRTPERYSARKRTRSPLREAHEQGSRVTVPTMVFRGEQGPHFTSLYNDLLVEEMKVASAIMRRILIETGSFVDIVTWDCLKKLTYLGRDIVLLVHPILGFGGQEVNPTREG
ncbi:hypothetical protein Cgig2_012096 [Carnegiea gigantea]|uniref:Uncharacterized protein n=1 Tax=Carnegiea gigantea TaxID=171969 RepID=A0A9Q1GI80_9CARY|nr:hypothetical protein Cgig2_012096 [Carnegiea gigantea]